MAITNPVWTGRVLFRGHEGQWLGHTYLAKDQQPPDVLFLRMRAFTLDPASLEGDDPVYREATLHFLPPSQYPRPLPPPACGGAS